MTIDPDQLPEMLMAYADGELDPISAKRVERAIAADPSLAEQVDQHRRLRATLAQHFAPIAEAPLPDFLRAMMPDPAVADLAAARATRRMITPTPLWNRWVAGSMMAACLVVGLMTGQMINRGPVETRDGVLVASGGLARALDTQLASAAGDAAPLKSLISFRDAQGTLCRSFSAPTLSGIACRADNRWQLRETRGGTAGPTTDYRQAGSADAALMADAQAMMAGEPLDAVAEAKAKAQGWR
ncbi:anti-sigma factor [Sphingomonas sp. 28-63-12]|uniref:anti-sigma factor family protein n=1 Tax=Sphingomonas sp. 28-63-12 TaxID=1970434 RepID=UPI000BD0FB97|nr:MAG: hypothetical protein B7Y47_07980 [Sphingomonas sp. 28-63-12]